jgi:hypothetical protein
MLFFELEVFNLAKQYFPLKNLALFSRSMGRFKKTLLMSVNFMLLKHHSSGLRLNHANYKIQIISNF